MGFPSFVKVIKYGCLAIFGLAAALAAIAVLSSPAAAQGGDGGNFGTPKPWDTDNLRYKHGGIWYTAASFNVPFHQYGGYSETACQKNVADGFFQAGGSVGAVNDFPYLDWVVAGDSGSWVVKEGGTRSKGCDEFVEQQDEMVSQIVGNGGYYLDLSGNLQKLGSIPARFSGRSLVYGNWNEKGDGFAVNGSTGEVAHRYDEHGYLSRVDGISSGSGHNRRYSRAIYPSGTKWTVPERTQNGRFGSGWHGTRSGNSVRVARPVISGGYLPNDPELCPARFHPRGEDSVDRIGGSTGRTLSGLTHAIGMTADRYWCRSDLRFERRFHPEIHSGVNKHPQAATSEFTAYGRLNCYYTAFTDTLHDRSYTQGIHQDTSSGGMVCSYLFPVPKCDPDTDNNSDTDWRDYTAKELKDISDDLGQGKFNKDEGQACPPAASTPPSSTPRLNAASFSGQACVTATLSIYENRVKGSDAEPGIQASHRTITADAATPAYDLDVTVPHPSTASPPRDTSDPSGCADGTESRADHGTASSAARKNTAAAVDGALPSSSAASSSTHPPHSEGFASAGTDYTGAVRNMAHRYASKIAENTCAAKRAEARLRIALLEAEAELYKDWMGRYSRWAKSRKDAFNGWRPSGYPSGVIDTSPSSYSTFYAFVHAKFSKARLDYARGMRARYAGLQSSTGAVAGTSLAKPSVSSSWCGDPSGLVLSYSGNVTALKTSAVNALRASSVTLAVVDSAYVVTPASSGTSTTTAGTAAVYETVREARTRTVTKRYMNCGLPQVPEDQWDELPDNHLCAEYSKQETETYYVNVRRVKTAEVKAAVEHSYPGYTLSVSGGGWSRSKYIAADTRTQTCGTWRTSSCPSAGSHPGHSYSDLLGRYPGVNSFPSTTGAPNISVGTPVLSRLLGKYLPQHADRANLENATAQTRNQAATDLGVLTTANAGTITPAAFSSLAVPSGNPATNSTETAQRTAVRTAAQTYQTAYTTAYDTAYSGAVSDMGSTATTTAWNNFAWSYEAGSLVWGGYQEDPATAYSGWAAQAGETEADRDGTGCDLISVSSDGAVVVEATRLDFETSSFGKGSVFGVRADAQRTCKIRRVRSPELLLEYQPSAGSGTDSSKTASFWHVNYQPTADAERFKLYAEAEVFAVRVSLADRAPVLCYQPGEALVAHVGAKGIDAVNEAVFRHASGFSGGSKKHCFRYPSVTRPAFAFFDDTAHSAMASVTAVWQQPAAKIVSKLGSTDDLKMMGDSVSLVASTAVPYNDSARTSSFYGTYYTFPADTSTKSPSGWNISGHPTLTLTSTFRQHVIQAKDTTTRTPAARRIPSPVIQFRKHFIRRNGMGYCL